MDITSHVNVLLEYLICTAGVCFIRVFWIVFEYMCL